MSRRRPRNKPATRKSNNPADRNQPAPPQVSSVQLQLEASSWKGPLPPPTVLEQYNQAVPDAASRILAMAENQSVHRMYLEKTVVEGDSRRATLGIVAGVVISLTVVGCSTFLIYQGSQWVGGSLIGINIVGLASTFIYGTKVRRDERERKRPLSS